MLELSIALYSDNPAQLYIYIYIYIYIYMTLTYFFG